MRLKSLLALLIVLLLTDSPLHASRCELVCAAAMASAPAHCEQHAQSQGMKASGMKANGMKSHTMEPQGNAESAMHCSMGQQDAGMSHAAAGCLDHFSAEGLGLCSGRHPSLGSLPAAVYHAASSVRAGASPLPLPAPAIRRRPGRPLPLQASAAPSILISFRV